MLSLILDIKSFSFCHFDSLVLNCSCLSASSFSISSSLILSQLFSFLIASFSISRNLSSFSRVSSSTGLLVELIFTLDAASSIRSIALSGSLRSAIYLDENSTAQTIALSLILIQ